MSRAKTQEQKELEGTDRVDRKGKMKVTDGFIIPKPQNFLDKAGIEIYNDIAKVLQDAKTIHLGDSLVLSMFAQTVKTYRDAIDTISLPKSKGGGTIQEYKNGTTNVSPAYTVMTKCEAIILTYARRFGLDTESREKLVSYKLETKKDEFENW